MNPLLLEESTPEEQKFWKNPILLEESTPSRRIPTEVLEESTSEEAAINSYDLTCNNNNNIIKIYKTVNYKIYSRVPS
jgi:hypothetical protein